VVGAPLTQRSIWRDLIKYAGAATRAMPIEATERLRAFERPASSCGQLSIA
jgi:hypothetical protein